VRFLKYSDFGRDEKRMKKKERDAGCDVRTERVAKAKVAEVAKV
jgi:hypothetical protein